ncbi:winged helix-turn-helix domain-containing protein [Variovorax sp. GB1P17]|uniref:winged helix-turn-helix domain-containing protein n=1 Tax=Variovorax sp. GB1P17 TaxID=3443740 RepID=UPI003F483239
MNILLLGAESRTRATLGSALWRSGFAVDVADPDDADARLSAGKPYALVLLDLAPPAATQAAIASVRRMTSTPLLVLTERGLSANGFEGLAPGTTEYLPQPCAMDHVLARAWALASPHGGADAALLRLADLAIDRKRGKAIRQGTELRLSVTQFELLDVLMASRGHVMSRTRLIHAVWGSRGSRQHDNMVTVAILRLRQRLDDPFDLKLIHTVHRKGYVLELRDGR